VLRRRKPSRPGVVRPLPRTYGGKTIAATLPDRVEIWVEPDSHETVTAHVWFDVVLPDQPKLWDDQTRQRVKDTSWMIEGGHVLSSEERTGNIHDYAGGTLADPDEQAAYLEQELEPRLAQAQAGQRAVFFVDAAHFVPAPFLGFLWSVARIFIKAPAGRQRFNVLGALNAITHPALRISVTNDTYITAESVCTLLHKLAALNLTVAITIFLDNARYQKCALVYAMAASLHIELCFLPAYSPNLNLIERLWTPGRVKKLFKKAQFMPV
jgi:hypothetical protein